MPYFIKRTDDERLLNYHMEVNAQPTLHPNIYERSVPVTQSYCEAGKFIRDVEIK